MGIDIYMKWAGQSAEEEKAQFTGYSAVAGNVGYLREAYHGGPYVTRFLVSEAFEAEGCEAAIPAAVLRERLPVAAMLAVYREEVVYGGGADPGTLNMDEGRYLEAIKRIFTHEIKSMEGQGPDVVSVSDEQRRAVGDLIARRQLPDFVLSFVDFVELAERKEAETGQPCTVHASY